MPIVKHDKLRNMDVHTPTGPVKIDGHGFLEATEEQAACLRQVPGYNVLPPGEGERLKAEMDARIKTDQAIALGEQARIAQEQAARAAAAAREAADAAAAASVSAAAATPPVAAVAPPADPPTPVAEVAAVETPEVAAAAKTSTAKK